MNSTPHPQGLGTFICLFSKLTESNLVPVIELCGARPGLGTPIKKQPAKGEVSAGAEGGAAPGVRDESPGRSGSAQWAEAQEVGREGAQNPGARRAGGGAWEVRHQPAPFQPMAKRHTPDVIWGHLAGGPRGAGCQSILRC